MLQEADYPIWLDTGPEPIAGSTRMKAGTAQRVALNLLSSLVMIRLGRVHQGLMVDVQAINAKLARRSETILRRLTGRGDDEVAAALRRANGSVKLAVLLLKGCSLQRRRACSIVQGGGCAPHSKTSAAMMPRRRQPRLTCRVSTNELPSVVGRDD